MGVYRSNSFPIHPSKKCAAILILVAEVKTTIRPLFLRNKTVLNRTSRSGIGSTSFCGLVFYGHRYDKCYAIASLF